MARHARLRRTLHTTREDLLRFRAGLHVGMPLVILLLAAVVIADLTGAGGSGTVRVLRWIEYAVLAYFVLELAVDARLYRDKRAFLRDRWVDLALLLPVVLLIQVGAWLGGLVLAGRAFLALEFVRAVGLELYAIEELTVAGSRLQRALKLTRRVRRLFRRDPDPR